MVTILFVREKWSSFELHGWGRYVLKEKLKMIKVVLKDWHASHTRNLPAKIDGLKTRQELLDGKGEEIVLSEEEMEELHGISMDIHSLSRLNTNICWQQSRLNWLRDGDANTKFFHSVLAGRRRHNSLSSIMVNGAMVEGVNPVRQAVFMHFKNHYLSNRVSQPSVGNMQFQRLSFMEMGTLTKSFSVDEVKAAVWDCDSFKSSSHDGINFGFIKNF